jgi:hypothetical protein
MGFLRCKSRLCVGETLGDVEWSTVFSFGVQWSTRTLKPFAGVASSGLLGKR